MIQCPYCQNHVHVVWIGGEIRLAPHGLCRGSKAVVRGNWRDDVTHRYAEHEWIERTEDK